MAADFAAARLNMVESQVRTNDVTDVRLHDAMRAIPREALIPADKAFQAYADADVEYAPGRFLLSKGQLVCAAHGATFETDAGLCVAGPCRGQSLRAVAVTVIGDSVFLATP